ncbi:IS66 family transposase [Deinococcus seoulensis]|uniref:IS66 family transposase n=1 Tax=Deinococcus seoulensis TaxID=1837379 RepID=UPI003571472B
MRQRRPGRSPHPTSRTPPRPAPPPPSPPASAHPSGSTSGWAPSTPHPSRSIALWRFLKDPDIPPTNNAAERSLRTVVMRGRSRSAARMQCARRRTCGSSPPWRPRGYAVRTPSRS